MTIMKKLSIVFIIIGITLIVFPIIGQIYTDYNIDMTIAEYSESTATEANIYPINPEEDYIQLQDAFNEEKSSQFTDKSIQLPPSLTVTPAATTSTITPKTTSKQAKPQTKQIVLGVIKINKIKVTTVIVEGVKPNNLSSGIGHLPGTPQIGQLGNCALAGHRSYTFGRFFNRLDELIKGDEILISTKKSHYKYRIYQILVVNPDDVSVLKGNKNESTVTLITCTPTFIATHRLIIHARLESQTDK